jgi:hypothetical protein
MTMIFFFKFLRSHQLRASQKGPRKIWLQIFRNYLNILALHTKNCYQDKGRREMWQMFFDSLQYLVIFFPLKYLQINFPLFILFFGFMWKFSQENMITFNSKHVNIHLVSPHVTIVLHGHCNYFIKGCAKWFLWVKDIQRNL